MSDDEFDNLPDDFSQIQNVDWDQLLSAPPPPPTLDPSPHNLDCSPDADSSTHYPSDDYELNSAFFEELDDLEKEIVQPQIEISRTNAVHGGERASGGHTPANNRNTRPPQSFKKDRHESKTVTQSPSRKRGRESSPITAPSKKGKTKASGGERVLSVLASLEDELTCPM
ncbi:hypothetical protein H0H92_004215 [Tricholoma furcatifolium]|nr:hypothetical protein H0H92_004215 [Tricholoma furcatifolium]